jgi:hypothetical protein
LRRHNKIARTSYAPLASKPTQPKVLPPVSKEEIFTIESIQKEIDAANILNIAMDRAFDIQGEFNPKYLVEHDEKLNRIGAGIEYLAEKKYGAPNDEKLRQAYDIALSEAKQAFKNHKETAIQSGMGTAEAIKYANSKAVPEFVMKKVEMIQPVLEKRNEAIRNALMDIGVVFADPDTLEFSKDCSDDDAINNVKSALNFYPQSWIDSSNRKHKEHSFRIITRDVRARYTDAITENIRGTEITYAELILSEKPGYSVSGDAGRATALHEFAHRVEQTVKGVLRVEETFLDRRTGRLPTPDGTPGDPEPLEHIVGTDPTKREVGYKDNFPHHYMGKYDEKYAWEILSTGMESLFTGAFGGLAGMGDYNADPDYKKFILGILASSANTAKRNSPSLLSKILPKKFKP